MQPSEPCVTEDGGSTGIDNCDVGAFCWDISPQNTGICAALCKGDAESPFCTDSSETCHFTSAGVGLIPLCLDKCDPLQNDCPSEKPLCLHNPSGAAYICAPDLSGPAGQTYEPCDFSEQCDIGHVCLSSLVSTQCDSQKSGCCIRYCDTSLSPDPRCDSQLGEVCNPIALDEDAPYDVLGYCAAP